MTTMHSNLSDLRDPSKAIRFATLGDLARLPRGRATPVGAPAEPQDADGSAILAAVGDGPLPADMSLLGRTAKAKRDPDRPRRQRSRRQRRARHARGVAE